MADQNDDKATQKPVTPDLEPNKDATGGRGGHGGQRPGTGGRTAIQ